MPGVVGLTLRQAKARIVKAHCRLGLVTKKASTVRKKGKVLAQKPRPGTRLKNGAKVNVTIGKGPRK